MKKNLGKNIKYVYPDVHQFKPRPTDYEKAAPNTHNNTTRSVDSGLNNSSMLNYYDQNCDYNKISNFMTVIAKY